jgi:hypothetical protein
MAACTAASGAGNGRLGRLCDEGDLPPQTLVDLVEHPYCVGEARRLVLEQLARHHHGPFADQWAFVDYVRQQKLGLDLTTPPDRLLTGNP